MGRLDKQFSIAASVAMLAMGLSGEALAASRSIVGAWHFSGESCENAITIGPLSLKSEDVSCTFKTVKRVGSTVTWKGACDDAEGSSQQTVTAVETDGRLTITYMPGGNVLENLERCG